jgi:HlyD family secretion protein
MSGKKKASVWIAGIAIALVAVAAFVWWQMNQDNGPPDFAAGNGRVEADLVDVATQITGRVVEVMVVDGDLVERGDVLVRIDTDRLEAQLASAHADVASALSEIREAAAMIEQREADLTFAQQELERASALLDRGFGTQEEVDRRLSVRNVARAALAAAEASRTSAEQSADAAEAQVREISITIEDATIISPVRGRVLYRLAEPGEVVGSGARVLTLVDLSRVYMEVFLSTAETARVALGAEARIAIDGTDLVIPATVSFVSPDAQFTPEHVETRDVRSDLMFRVRLRVPQDLIERNIDYVKTGMRGTGHIRLAGSQDVPWPDDLTLSDAPPLGDEN